MDNEIGRNVGIGLLSIWILLVLFWLMVRSRSNCLARLAIFAVTLGLLVFVVVKFSQGWTEQVFPWLERNIPYPTLREGIQQWGWVVPIVVGLLLVGWLLIVWLKPEKPVMLKSVSLATTTEQRRLAVNGEIQRSGKNFDKPKPVAPDLVTLRAAINVDHVQDEVLRNIVERAEQVGLQITVDDLLHQGTVKRLIEAALVDIGSFEELVKRANVKDQGWIEDFTEKLVTQVGDQIFQMQQELREKHSQTLKRSDQPTKKVVEVIRESSRTHQSSSSDLSGGCIVLALAVGAVVGVLILQQCGA